jgi:hypothetical protein
MVWLRPKAAPSPFVVLDHSNYPSVVGAVFFSHSARIAMASSLHDPHISSMGRKEPHTFGRSGDPKILQRNSLSNWMHGTPAGLPFGMPGIGDDIDGAMQHAPQPGRHFIFCSPVCH